MGLRPGARGYRRSNASADPADGGGLAAQLTGSTDGAIGRDYINPALPVGHEPMGDPPGQLISQARAPFLCGHLFHALTLLEQRKACFGATLASICPPCAERAKLLRAAQCREGWHLEEEPGLARPRPMRCRSSGSSCAPRRSCAVTPLRPPGRTTDYDELIGELDTEIARVGIRGKVTTHHGSRDGKQRGRRSRSTRRRQDAAPLPARKIAPRTTGRVYTAPDGKRYRPSMFLTLTCGSYGKVNDDGTPADPASYDYTRAARDAIHFAALFDRFIQNLRRVLGYEAQYFGGVEPQKRLAPHLHLAASLDPASTPWASNLGPNRATCQGWSVGPIASSAASQVWRTSPLAGST